MYIGSSQSQKSISMISPKVLLEASKRPTYETLSHSTSINRYTCSNFHKSNFMSPITHFLLRPFKPASFLKLETIFKYFWYIFKINWWLMCGKYLLFFLANLTVSHPCYHLNAKVEQKNDACQALENSKISIDVICITSKQSIGTFSNRPHNR